MKPFEIIPLTSRSDSCNFLNMVKVVTQETFDEYVRENMEEFDMSKEEAIQEAKDQLLTQVRSDKYVINALGSNACLMYFSFIHKRTYTGKLCLNRA